MVFVAVAVLCAGLFAGAALYLTFVEHPARLECGTELAATEFPPSYRRATVMQASLEARMLLERWGRLHALRSVSSTVAFLVLLADLAILA